MVKHFKGINHDLKYLRQKLGFTNLRTNELLENTAYLITGILGSREIKMFLSIQGISESGNINEEISELIRLRYGQNVDPEHGKIKSLKRCRIGTIDQLVNSSGRHYLEQAFKGLCTVLREIEEDPSH